MKRILRSFLIEIGCLFLVTQVASGIEFKNGLESLVIAGVALTLATFVAKPIINILLLPLNLVTFGVFKWISQAVTLFLVDLVLNDFAVTKFAFMGYNTTWVYVPPLELGNIVLAYIAFSLLISIIGGVIYWLVK